MLNRAQTQLELINCPEMTASEELQMTSLDEAEAFCRSVEEDPNSMYMLLNLIASTVALITDHRAT